MHTERNINICKLKYYLLEEYCLPLVYLVCGDLDVLPQHLPDVHLGGHGLQEVQLVPLPRDRLLPLARLLHLLLHLEKLVSQLQYR